MRLNTLTRSDSPQFKVASFEGPLHLLLHLIREHEVDLYDIPIAQITQQYLDYLAQMQSMDLGIAGEYLVMAATLIEIKSRMLLPLPPSPEDDLEPVDPRAELVQRLLEYQLFQTPVETLREWEGFRRQLFFRGAIENPDDYLLPTAQGEMHPNSLMEALMRVLSSAGVEDSAVTSVMPKRRVSLKMKMAEVIRRVQSTVGPLGFEELFEMPCYKYEIVLTFLALLELLRLNRLTVNQKNPLDPILITIVETNSDGVAN